MSWELGYQHDKSGKRIAGDKDQLIAAVQNGLPIRVVMEGSDLQYATYAQALWVKDGNVYAQNTSHVSVSFEGARLRFRDDSYWWMIIVDTQGHRDMIRWNVGEHTLRGHTEDRVAIKWYFFDSKQVPLMRGRPE